MNLYENVILEGDINDLRTPTRNLHYSDKLYLKRNGSMIYLGTYGEVRANSDDLDGNLIDKDGINYGHFNRPSIDENLFILKPEESVQKNSDGEKNTNAGNFKSRKSHSKRSHRKKSHRKKSRHRKSHYKRSRHR
jgi:hypothetical protein